MVMCLQCMSDDECCRDEDIFKPKQEQKKQNSYLGFRLLSCSLCEHSEILPF